jgi:parallel beta-helix repeat protein
MQLKLIFLLLFFATLGFTDGDISTCSNLTTNGTYTLTVDVTSTGNCMLFAQNNTILDCQMHSMTGLPTNASGIGVSSPWSRITKNLTVMNCVINSFYTGISFVNNANITTVQNNTIWNATYQGINFLGATSVNNIITQNNITQVTNQTGSIAGIGIYMTGTSSRNNTVTYNTIYNTTNNGLQIKTSPVNVIAYNNISLINGFAAINCSAMAGASSGAINLSNNLISSAKTGIYLDSTTKGVNISNNVITNTTTGISLNTVTTPSISTNSMTNNSIYNTTNYLNITDPLGASVTTTSTTLGYNSSVGTVFWSSLSLAGEGNPILVTEGTNIYLQPSFISVDDTTLPQFNTTANIINLSTDAGCANNTVWKKSGFPSTASDITVNGSATPISSTCSAGLANFTVSSFSGYSMSDNTGVPIIQFVSPTPINGTNNFTYGMVFNFTSNTNMTDCLMEIDGVNQTGTVSADNIACSYTVSDAEHIFNNTYDIIGYGNVSGTMYPTNETRVIPYYGCGYVNGNGTLLGNVSTIANTCFTFLTNPDLTLDGAGYTVSGIGTYGSTGIGSYMNGITIKNVSIKDFGIGINVEGGSSGSTFTNLTIFNSTGGMTCGAFGNAGICLCTVGSHTVSNSIIYGGINDGIYISGTNNNISNNTIYNNQNRGLHVDGNSGADGNIIINNIIYNNSVSQIRASGMLVTNRIYNNILNASIGQATTEDFSMPPDFTTWNTTKTLITNIIGGANIGGNWYSDYVGVDMNGDGLGEAPYSVPASGNIDYLPLTNNNSGVVYFDAITPTNGTNNFTYGIIFNMTASPSMPMSTGYIEVDGTNQTCSLASDNLSCSYALSYPEHLFNHTYSAIGYANFSGSYNITNETRIVPYYGCGYVNGNGTMLGNVSRDMSNGDACFVPYANNTIFDGAGYTLSSNSTSGSTGILFTSYTTNNSYKNLNIYGFGIGVAFQRAHSNNLTNSTLYNNVDEGAEIGLSNNCVFTNNTVFGSPIGLIIASANTNNITNNTIRNNSVFGISISLSSSNNIINNTLYGNTNYQFAVGGSSPNNLIYNNIFNATGFLTVSSPSSINYWNTTKTLSTNILGGTNIGGNRYSNYTGKDFTGDGIGDRTYSIAGGNIDYLPLANTQGNVTFVSPTLANNSNFTTPPVILNMTTDDALQTFDTGYMEINGTNQTCTLASDNKSCSYSWSPITLGSYPINGFANFSGTYVKTNETRTLNYTFNAYFTSPTPLNATNTSLYPVIMNITANRAFSSPCYFEINSTNYTSTNLSSDNLSCSYLFYPPTHGYTYNYTGYANDTGTITQVNESRQFTWNAYTYFYFNPPTPANGTNTSLYPIPITINATAPLSSPCLVEVNGTNYTGIVSTNNLSCSYNFTPAAHGGLLTIRGFMNSSTGWIPTNSTLYITWYNATRCINLTDVFNIYQNQTTTLTNTSTYLYARANITLNNTCLVDISNHEYDINDSVADANWTSYLVNLTSAELKNFTQYDFRIPITFTDVGEIVSGIFVHPDKLKYSWNSTYTRPVLNITFPTTYHTPNNQIMLYTCTNSSSTCATYNLANYGIPVAFTANNTVMNNSNYLYLYRAYVVNWLYTGGSGDLPPAPSQGGGGTTPIGTPTTPSLTTVLAQGIAGMAGAGNESNLTGNISLTNLVKIPTKGQPIDWRLVGVILLLILLALLVVYRYFNEQFVIVLAIMVALILVAIVYWFIKLR